MYLFMYLMNVCVGVLYYSNIVDIVDVFFANLELLQGQHKCYGCCGHPSPVWYF